MKVARKGVKFFITALFVGGLSFGTTYFFTHNNAQETFAKIEEKIEDSELVKTVEMAEGSLTSSASHVAIQK